MTEDNEVILNDGDNDDSEELEEGILDDEDDTIVDTTCTIHMTHSNRLLSWQHFFG